MPTLFGMRRGAFLLGLLVIGLVVIVSLTVVVRSKIAAPTSALAISVLSSPPDAVTGSSARVQVSKPATVDINDVRVLLNGGDITGQLTRDDAGLQGVITGLAESDNTLSAQARGAAEAVVTLVNHPASGPMLSGPQQTPFVCDLANFTTVAGEPLAAQGGSDCEVASRSNYVYRSKTRNAFRPLTGAALADPAKRPADLAKVTLADGTVQPYIVRVEALTIDRGVAQIAMLHDPAASSDAGWNRKLVYGFGGGGCGAGHQQGNRTFNVLATNNLLSAGFAVASNSLNVTGQNCNDVLAAEAFTMTREYFIKTYGAPIYTMGTGCSGGASQALQIADNYPGLLNGIVVGCSLADLGFDLGQLTFDARLLVNFDRRHPDALTKVQLSAVSGLDSNTRLTKMSELADMHDPANSLGAVVPSDQRFDAKTNPKGTRSSVWDQTVNVYGANAQGETNRPMGNTGVQYGLQALKNGNITVKQFLNLNAEIGGLDANLSPTTERTRASADATARAYSTGRMLNGGEGLSTIPIIDYRSNSYGPGDQSLDLRQHTFAIEQRLVAANGDADNQVRLTDSGHGRFNLERGVLAEAVRQMDTWLVALAKSPYVGHGAVVASKPVDLVDACFTPDGKKTAEPQVFSGSTTCNKIYPTSWTPRMVAGGPLSSDVISCALKPPSREDYPASMTPAQFEKVEGLFSDGVCDWSRPGDGQRAPTGTWQRY